MLVEGLLKRSGYNADDVVARFHRQAIQPQDIPVEELHSAFQNNLMVGCFRWGVRVVEKIDDFDIVPILVTRDPRDCQLSWFHARHLHRNDPLPPQMVESAELSKPLTVGDTFLSDIAELHAFATEKNGLIIKYEDILQDPIAFLLQVAEYIGIRPDRAALDLTIMEANFLQLVSDEENHNRRGRPYEALNSLSPEELAELNEVFGEAVTALGYPLTADDLPTLDLAALQARDVYKRFAIRLAEENSYRISEIQHHQRVINELQTENGYRIEEIRRINETLMRMRAALSP
ncbi:sulfotransferase domain-containing protein [Rhizobium sp. SG2393]|uniref:sulfotransferase domain-containing protein n=1 Tax=Rhizobium sp. SG2393 TaxID=3276279 RepID=UPI00366BD48F